MQIIAFARTVTNQSRCHTTHTLLPSFGFLLFWTVVIAYDYERKNLTVATHEAMQLITENRMKNYFNSRKALHV